MWIKRVGKTNGRVTQGRIYPYDPIAKKIRDDDDGLMEPCLNKAGYWEVVDNFNLTMDDEDRLRDKYSLERYLKADAVSINIGKAYKKAYLGSCYYPAQTPSITKYVNVKQENKMKISTKVEKVTLINDSRSDAYTIESIIDLIKAEEEKLERLNTVNAKSKALENLKVKHRATIDQLVEVLDSREE